jgi:hypothetical protein
MEDLSELDALLVESVEQTSKAKAQRSVGELRDRLASAYSRTPDRKALIREFKAAELQYEWATVELVAMTDRTACACGLHNEHFVGLYYRQVSLVSKSGRRLIAVSQVADNLVGAAIEDLPRSRVHRKKLSLHCSTCLAVSSFGTASTTLEIAE